LRISSLRRLLLVDLLHRGDSTNPRTLLVWSKNSDELEGLLNPDKEKGGGTFLRPSSPALGSEGFEKPRRREGRLQPTFEVLMTLSILLTLL
jgi:hypothetical protein